MYVQVYPIITLSSISAPLLLRRLSSIKQNRNNNSLNTHPADRGQYSHLNQIKLENKQGDVTSANY